MDVGLNVSGFQPEPLTQRERNILAHLAKDQSSQEIAGLETLAPSSVKWYIHQVYAKLGVNTREAALARAAELGLLRSEAAVPEEGPVSRNNLPRQLTSFIGREAEIAQLLGFVRAMPLVTLTGSGGTGKTRLALQVATSALDAFPDGVWLVNLAPLSDPDLVPLVTSAALGMRSVPREAAISAIGEYIRRKHLLLILDNCEHLISAAASLVSELLQASPALHILATSRELLGIAGEKTMRCPPLTLPDLQSHPPYAELARSEGVRLFVERAQSLSSSFALTKTNAPQIAGICQKLDGIPLAIELAAARVRLLSIDQIAARLEDVFHLLTGGGRTVPARHQTVKALIDWSYNLLSEPERCLLRRLSVFAGSWTLAAAEAVCACPDADNLLPFEQILDLLGQLVDKSLVSVQDGTFFPGSESRYSMLEMVRQYASHRLLESAGVEAAREQHLDYYLALSLEAELHLRKKGSREWKKRLNAEIDNIRLAIDWSFSRSIEKGLRLAAALQWYWFGTGNRIEGVGWLNRLLAAEANEVSRANADPNRVLLRKIARGKALNASSYTGIMIGQDGQGMGAEAAAIFKSLGGLCPKDLAYSQYLSGEKSPLECLPIFQEIGDPFFICEMLLFMTHAARWRGDFSQARAFTSQNLSLNRESGDQDGEGAELWELGMLNFLDGDYPQALLDFQASQACYDDREVDEIYPFCYRFYAWIALVQGDIPQAMRYSQAELSASREHFAPWVIADALCFLGWEAFTGGDEQQAVQYCQEALSMARQVSADILSIANYVLARVAILRGEFERAQGFLNAFVTSNYHSYPPVQVGLQVYGILAARQMQPHRAAVLFGAQDEVQDRLMNVIPQPEREEYQQALASVRAALSADDFVTSYAEGRAMTTEEAIQFAQQELG